MSEVVLIIKNEKDGKDYYFTGPDTKFSELYAMIQEAADMDEVINTLYEENNLKLVEFPATITINK